MSIIKWHDQLSAKIRGALLFFILLTVLDSSTLFDIPISETLPISSNLSTWLSSLILGIGFVDSFAFPVISLHLMLIVLLFGVVKDPFRNIWSLRFTLACSMFIIFVTSYQIIEPSNSSAVLLNGTFQSIKLIPLILAHQWTRQLATPALI